MRFRGLCGNELLPWDLVFMIYDFLFDGGQYKRRNGARIAPYRLIAEKMKKSAFLFKISENDRKIVRISVNMRIARQIGFGDTYLDVDFLANLLYSSEVAGDG